MKQLKVLAEEYWNYPMGLTVIGDRLHVSVTWAGERCSLVLFEQGRETPCQIIAMDPKERRGDVWNLTLALEKGLSGKLEYCFELDGVMTPDPCGRAMRGREEWGQPPKPGQVLRSLVKTEEFDWGDDVLPGIPMEDCVIYRVHVRGLTKHASSGVRDKGTFKAVAAKIPYMKELGITTVELMPVIEFSEIISGQGPRTEAPRINYWGYTDGYGFAPKASYSAGKRKNPVGELKQLVRTLHQEGMELVLQLYFDGSENPGSVLDEVRYWVQEFHLDGVHLIGNAPAELIGQDPYLSRTKLWAEYWKDEFVQKGNAGGRRNGVSAASAGSTPEKGSAGAGRNDTAVVNGNAGGRGNVPGRLLADCNDGFMQDMRRFLKGDEGQIRQALLRIGNGSGRKAVINYIADTNGFSLADMVSYGQRHNEANGEDNLDGICENLTWNCGEEGPSRKKAVLDTRRRQLRNALLFLFLSRGTPLLVAGDEFGHTKLGNNNTYCQDNELSWLNWGQLKTNKKLYEFAKHAVAFRKAHPVLRGRREARMTDYLSCGFPDVSYHGVKAWYPEYEAYRRQIGILYCGEYETRNDGSHDDYIYIMYNMHWDSYQFGLPTLPKELCWHVAMDTSRDGINGYYEEGQEPVLNNQRQYTAEGRSIAVLLGKAPEKDAGPAEAPAAGPATAPAAEPATEPAVGSAETPAAQ